MIKVKGLMRLKKTQQDLQ